MLMALHELVTIVIRHWQIYFNYIKLTLNELQFCECYDVQLKFNS